MQKQAMVMVVSAALIISGLILLVAGSQTVLEGVGQGNGMVGAGRPLTVAAGFGADVRTGVFAVQVAELDGALSAAVLDPSGVEIATHTMNSESLERRFGVADAGTYELVVRSAGGADVHVFGAIGPVPDAGKRSLGFAAVYVLVAGMIGLVGVGIYGIKKRKSV